MVDPVSVMRIDYEAVRFSLIPGVQPIDLNDCSLEEWAAYVQVLIEEMTRLRNCAMTRLRDDAMTQWRDACQLTE